jgi:hypothetical protein
LAAYDFMVGYCRFLETRASLSDVLLGGDSRLSDDTSDSEVVGMLDIMCSAAAAATARERGITCNDMQEARAATQICELQFQG